MLGHRIKSYYLNVVLKANISDASLNQIFIFGLAKHLVPILGTKLDMPEGNSNRMIVSVIQLHKTDAHSILQNTVHTMFVNLVPWATSSPRIFNMKQKIKNLAEGSGDAIPLLAEASSILAT